MKPDLFLIREICRVVLGNLSSVGRLNEEISRGWSWGGIRTQPFALSEPPDTSAAHHPISRIILTKGSVTVMDFLNEILSCLCGSAEPASEFYLYEKHSPEYDASVHTNDKAAIDVVSVLLQSEKHGASLKKQLDEAVGTLGWSEMLAKRILNALVETIRNGRDKMGPAFAKAYDDAVNETNSIFHKLVQEARDYPLEIAATVVITIIAIGVLVALAPYILELLGFSELGPVEGKLSCS
jgi:hypothetical protein